MFAAVGKHVCNQWDNAFSFFGLSVVVGLSFFYYYYHYHHLVPTGWLVHDSIACLFLLVSCTWQYDSVHCQTGEPMSLVEVAVYMEYAQSLFLIDDAYIYIDLGLGPIGVFHIHNTLKSQKTAHPKPTTIREIGKISKRREPKKYVYIYIYI